MSNLAMMMGLGSGAEGVAVAEVFSTDLYTGTGQDGLAITNDIDLDGSGGLVWIKRRNGGTEHVLQDSERGLGTGTSFKQIYTNLTSAQNTSTNEGVTSFNSNGFTLDNGSDINSVTNPYVAWTWRKAPKWFDIVEYTGTGAAQTISHSLGSEVGMIFIKQTSTGLTDWSVYHRSLGGTKNLRLDANRAEATNSGYFNDTDATSTEFTVGYLGDFNSAGATYITYLFAHNESLIQCGSYTGNGSTTGPEIDLGWQPQWVMIKNTSTAADWYVLDAERGLNGDAIDDPYLRPNLNNVESSTNILKLTATGFQLNSAGLTGVNRNGDNYIYMAIKAED